MESYFVIFAHSEDLSIDEDEMKGLYCPKRPKWKYYMTKKEVEKVSLHESEIQSSVVISDLLFITPRMNPLCSRSGF